MQENMTSQSPPLFIGEGDKLQLLDPETGRHLPTADVREEFARMTAATPRDHAFERAFLRNKLRVLETHPDIGAEGKRELGRRIHALLGDDPAAKTTTPPVPGGVGYGAFYNDSFKKAYNTGTVLAVDYIAPTKPGGNVDTYLYLTATNRTAKGVEAFVLYYAQNSFAFRVFDWARDDHWQTNIPFSSLSDYITKKSAHGTSYQVISIQNQTYVKSGNTWTNVVWLQNYKMGRYDLIYSYDYTSSESEQKADWVGSWGPIVETFQDPYQGTNQFGCLRAYLQARDSSNKWSSWALLSSSQSYIRTDDVGFSLVFLDANHSFAVDS